MSAVLIIWGERRPPSSGGRNPVFSLRGDRFSVDVFGFPGTVYHGGGADEGFLTVGLGIQDGRFWDSARWEQAAKSGDFPPNGHYLKIRWGGRKLTIENDPLGLRDIFWARWRNGFVISSRLDWVAKISGANRVNFRVIGSLWLGPSMLNWDSPVEGVFRLGPGGKVVFDGAEFVHTRPRLYQYPRGERTTPRQTLEKLAEITTAQAELVRYLSLSGGIDSRGLLAVLMGSAAEWRAFTFGLGEEPDILIVRDMAQKLGFPLEFRQVVLEDGDRLWGLLEEHAARKWITIPVSVAPALESLGALAGRNAVNIDGGLGEVLRQRVLRRLAPFPGIKLSPPLVRKLISAPLPPIFSDEVAGVMSRGYDEDIERALDMCRGLSAGQVAEIWALWFRLPNFSGLEQARLDEFVFNFMPYVQPEVLDLGLRMPPKERRRAAVHILAMERFAPQLKKFPVARFGRILPFGVGKNPYLMRVFLPFLRDRQTPVENAFFRRMAQTLRERIYDILASRDFAEYEPYRHDFIRRAVEKYFAGDDSFKDVLVWWLTFELWRRSLG